ncbi:geranylgeranylglyceryl/heptaprenylglyceryl phosphate synthase [Algoriphagus limi]|uniref:Geranylgeranylglyceryl phosphate synthase n=1 Tax=Algoriphagus limi TaxID=2975273 RepID=A0ABT2G6B3_9BACT|nr:geranylgeranylglyceryl/heptaprenylglyceryl phosphate synthase [Algoriphagus limi]MCS5490803.1 geranylgeranylglyceryl/heptaprenylglyceryl phosphate synthase [Algoriphagus limi]
MPKQQRKVSNAIQQLFENKKKGVAWLIDPGKFNPNSISDVFWANLHGLELDLILVGGSQDESSDLGELIQFIKERTSSIPVVLFPGSYQQVCPEADAILFMSLISGRNPEYLISQQVRASRATQNSGLEVLPTAYLLVNDGEICSVHRKSETLPISNEELDLILDTALAGKFLGMNYCYLDAGSGSSSTVAPAVIRAVSSELQLPLIVGGGLNKLQKIHQCFEAGADVVVIGNQIEKDPGFLTEVLNFKKFYNEELHVN